MRGLGCQMKLPQAFCYLNLSALQPEEPAAGPKGPQRARRARSGPEGPARGPEGPARASVARPLYLKLLTRHTIKLGTKQAKMLHMRQTKSHTYHSIICTEKSPVQDVTSPPVQI